MPELLKTGDRVEISCEGRTVTGTVLLASGNGRSLALEYEAILAGFVGSMPVMQRDDGSYVALTGTPITLRRVT
jgi:hypothetical protein